MSLFKSNPNKELINNAKALVDAVGQASGEGKKTKAAFDVTSNGQLIIELKDKNAHSRAAHSNGEAVENALAAVGIENENKPKIIPGTEDENGRPEKTAVAIMQHIDGRDIKTLVIDGNKHGGNDGLTEKLAEALEATRSAPAAESTSFRDKVTASRAPSADKGNSR